MTRRFRVSGSAAVTATVLLAGCAAGPSTPPAPPTYAPGTAAGDLDVLLERLEATHPQPFHGIRRTDFVAALRDLQQRLPELDADLATVEVMRLVGLLSRAGRDGHQFALPQAGHEGDVLPLRVYEFREGVFVTAAMDPYEDLIGAEVTAIGTLPIAEVLDRLEPLVPRDGPATVPAFRPVFLLRTEVLRGLGIAPDGPIAVTVRDAGGVREASLDPVPFATYVDWAGGFGMLRLPDRAGLLYLSTGGDILHVETLPTGGAYLRYQQVQTPGVEALDQARDLLSSAETDGVVLDLRQNPGGDNHNNASMITLLSDYRAAHPGAPIVVITDRVTFSAAANLATDLERSVDPVFVGEAMGGGLNFWDDVSQVRLDHLPVPMQVGVSTRYWQRSTPDDPRLTIEPDIATPVTAADYFADRDPALEAATGVLDR